MRFLRFGTAIRRPLDAAIYALCALSLSSCINSNNTRFPTAFNFGPEYERNQAAIQDPYPDSIAGPDAGFRPNEFAQERPEPDRARDRWVATQMRQDYQQNNPGGAQPLFAPATMSPYPGAGDAVAPGVASAPYVPAQPMVVMPYPPPPPPYPPYPAVVPIGPTATGPYWMPYSPPVVVRPIVLPRFSVHLSLPFH